MIVSFDRSFSKWISKVKNKKVKDLTIDFIGKVESTKSIEDLSSIKKLKGSKIAYRKGLEITGLDLSIKKEKYILLSLDIEKIFIVFFHNNSI